MMRPLRLLPYVMALTLLTACGGGGGGSSTPAPPPVAPTPTPTSPPAAAPTPVPVGNSTAAALVLNDDGVTVYPSGSPVIVASPPATAPSPIDGISCNPTAGTALHFHVHVTVFNNGTSVAVPAGIGLYRPAVAMGTSFYEPTQCGYDIHSHGAQGVIHIESNSATAKFSLKQLLDIWGVSLTQGGFGSLVGNTRVFITDLDKGGVGTHPVTEVTLADQNAVFLSAHNEITIEVGTPVPTPNYTWNRL